MKKTSERECEDCYKKTRDWYEYKMYVIVKDSSQPLGESTNPIPFGSLGRKYLCKECMESLKEIWELCTRDSRDDIPQCLQCGKNTHEYWDERIYGYRCVECGYMHITRYQKSWAVEDPEEREALIRAEDEIFEEAEQQVKAEQVEEEKKQKKLNEWIKPDND